MMELGETLQIGSVINKAIKISALGDKEKRKELYKPLASQLWEILLQGTTENITEFNNIMNFLLLSNRKDKEIDRAIWFISFVIGGLLDTDVNKCYNFANGFLINIAMRSGSSEKTVRIRCCQFIRMILAELSEDFEIDIDVAEKIQESLLVRVKDVYSEVRVQSIYALERFTSPGPNGDFSDDEVTNAYYNVINNDSSCMVRAAALNCLPITKKFCDALVEKTRDLSDVVRANSYKLFEKKIDPRNLSSDEVHNIMQNGLNDRCETVNATVQAMLISWLKNHYNNDFISFLTLFDIKLSYHIISDIIEIFIEHNDKTSILSYIEKTNGLRSANLDNLIECIFWKSICLKVKQEADNCTRRAMEAAGMEAEHLTLESEALLDLLDSILPESIISFVEKIKYQILNKRLKNTFELMIIIQNCISLGDIGERKIIAEFIKESFLNAPGFQIELQTEYIEHLSALGWMVWSNPEEFSEIICTILLDIKSNLDFSKDNNLDSEQLTTWNLIVREMLRLMPTNISNVQALGCTNFSFTDLLKTLVSIFHRYRDDETLSITIENLGLYSLMELSPSVSGMILPLITRSLNIDSEKVKVMAVRVLCSLSLSYGIRNIDSNHLNFEVDDFKPLWQFKYETNDGLVSFILKMLSIDNREEKDDYELELEIIESLCKLLIFNRFQRSKGLTSSESIRILTVFLTYLANTENSKFKKIQKMLEVFFESYMQMHIINHKYLQLAFIPAIYAAFKISNHKGHVIKTVTNLANFLQIQPNVKKLNLNTSNTNNGIGQCQLACIILWELVNCPNMQFIKSYTNVLWKTLLSLDFNRDSILDIQNFYRLLKYAKSKFEFSEKEVQKLEQKLKDKDIIDEEQEYFENENAFKEIKNGLDMLFIQYGKHPLYSIDE